MPRVAPIKDAVMPQSSDDHGILDCLTRCSEAVPAPKLAWSLLVASALTGLSPARRSAGTVSRPPPPARVSMTALRQAMSESQSGVRCMVVFSGGYQCE